MSVNNKIKSFLLKIGIIGIVTICLIELSYRFQIVDFYRPEWSYLNRSIKENAKESTVLVFGDSFSSAANSWVNSLREMNPEVNYYNASIPGVATETYRLIEKRRLEEVKPKKVIVQLYIGNDLYDIQKPVVWSKFSFSRNLFWSFSNYFRSFNFINYKMGQVSQDVVSNIDPKIDAKFSVAAYSKRTKLYIESTSNYPLDIIKLENETVFKRLLKDLGEMKSRASESEFYVLLIPHCIQVSKEYQDNFIQLGVSIKENVLQDSTWSKKLSEEGFRVINPTNCFYNLEMSGVKLFYENDPHLNDIGQKELANFVNNYLIESNEE